jgi:hypothetical protein
MREMRELLCSLRVVSTHPRSGLWATATRDDLPLEPVGSVAGAGFLPLGRPKTLWPAAPAAAVYECGRVSADYSEKFPWNKVTDNKRVGERPSAASDCCRNRNRPGEARFKTLDFSESKPCQLQHPSSLPWPIPSKNTTLPRRARFRFNASAASESRTAPSRVACA